MISILRTSAVGQIKLKYFSLCYWRFAFSLRVIFSWFRMLSMCITRSKTKEEQLREDFKTKYQLAANLKLYREQLAVMEEQFAELLKMLPSENEMPGLLDDLTFVATDAGLRINSLNWEPEIQRDFYIEFPIKMSVTGDYHQIGNMVSGVAKLPRIVSLHDFTIKRDESGNLAMDILAKTYRFKEGAELPPENAANNKGRNNETLTSVSIKSF